MVTSSYFDPKPEGTLSQIFRYWTGMHFDGPKMTARLKRLIKAKVIKVEPPLPRGWQALGTSYEYFITIGSPKKTCNRQWAHEYRYRILKRHRLLGPKAGVPIVSQKLPAWLKAIYPYFSNSIKRSGPYPSLGTLRDAVKSELRLHHKNVAIPSSDRTIERGLNKHCPQWFVNQAPNAPSRP